MLSFIWHLGQNVLFSLSRPESTALKVIADCAWESCVAYSLNVLIKKKRGVVVLIYVRTDH